MSEANDLIFLLRTCLDEMCKLSSPPEQIQITGGFTSLDILNQRLANLSAFPVYRPTDCEATARGTAYLLAGQPHHWPEEDAGDWFNPEENLELEKRYKKWMALILNNIRKI